MKRKLFITQLQGLGDTVLFMPHLFYLSEFFEITVAVVNDAAYALLKAMKPDIKIIKFKTKYQILTWRSFEYYDLAVTPCCPGRAELLCLFHVKADQKISFYDPRLAWTKFFPYCSLPTLDPEHDFKNNLSVIRHLVKNSEEEILSWFIKSYDIQNVPGKYVVLHPTASTSEKFYPKDFWQSIEKGLIEREIPYQIITGKSQIEMDFCLSTFSNHEAIVPQPKMDKLINILKFAKYYVGLDSGPAHLASIMGVKTVVLWGNASHARIRPYGSDTSILISQKYLKNFNLFGYKQVSNEHFKAINSKTVFEIIEKDISPNFTYRNMNSNCKIILYG